MTVAVQRLPRHRPLWRLTAITGSEDTRVALVVVFHHVLADGIGGLAVLARLVDGAATAAATGFPRPAPTRRALAADAVHTRLEVLSQLGEVVPTLRRAATELKPSAAGRAPVTTLNGPTGGRRQLAVTRADLAGLRHTARAHGATINDVVLTAITGGVAALLDRRGQPVRRLGRVRSGIRSLVGDRQRSGKSGRRHARPAAHHRQPHPPSRKDRDHYPRPQRDPTRRVSGGPRPDRATARLDATVALVCRPPAAGQRLRDEPARTRSGICDSAEYALPRSYR